MREARSLLALVTALAVSACARQQQTYYVIDPNTGQPVPVVNQQAYSVPSMPPISSSPMSAQASANNRTSDSRGLFSSSPAYAQQTYADPAAYAQATPQSYAQPQAASPQAAPSERGLFNSRPAAQPQYAPQTYAQPQPRQPYVAQYNPPRYAQPQPQYVPQPQYAPQPQYQQQGGPYAAAPYGYASAPANGSQQSYTVDSGDRLRVVVFGQDGITNSYMVDAGGNIGLPLIGIVPARGQTTQQLARSISERLKQGYVREPSVTVDVESYRPFFILGEVTNPGQYPYVPNMTAETAVAIAGGFAPRAQKGKVEISRNLPGQQFKGDVPTSFALKPGDTIVVKERWF
jgi:polysaccharide export outer membrane protein